MYLGSTYIPSDDACFSRFEAEIAGVPFARIVAAAEIGVDPPGPAEEGGSR